MIRYAQVNNSIGGQGIVSLMEYVPIRRQVEDFKKRILLTQSLKKTLPTLSQELFVSLKLFKAITSYDCI